MIIGFFKGKVMPNVDIEVKEGCGVMLTGAGRPILETLNHLGFLDDPLYRFVEISTRNTVTIKEVTNA